jgi:LysM repeat protein
MMEEMEERKEPEVEVNHEPEEKYIPQSRQEPRRPFVFHKRLLLFIIFLLGAIGLGFGLWMVVQSGVFSSKKQTDIPELSTFRAEIEKVKGEIDPLKKEIQSLKEEIKVVLDRINVFQGQITTLKDQVKISAKKKDPQEDKKPASKVIAYKIKKGDTLASIANKFRVNPDELRRWNNLPVKGKLNPGQVITIYSPIP